VRDPALIESALVRALQTGRADFSTAGVPQESRMLWGVMTPFGIATDGQASSHRLFGRLQRGFASKPTWTTRSPCFALSPRGR